MLFVTNNHILLKFRGGKAVTLLSNGNIVSQRATVQKILDEQSIVVGESQIIDGQKTILLEQLQVKNLEKTRHVALRFDLNG